MNKFIKIRIFQFLLVICICFAFGYIFGTNTIKVQLQNYIPILSIQSKNPPPGQNINMSLFYQVLDQINQNYYDKSKINPQQMVYGAIDGMIATLNDPFTSFFPPQQNTAFKDQMSGQFTGIGAELGTTNGKVIVVSPIDGSPADKAGIKAGDQILQVDGASIASWSLQDVVNKIRGPQGTTVTLTIQHVNSTKPVDITITRNTIQVKSVTGWVKNVKCTSTNSCQEVANCSSCATVAYIDLSEFGDNTNEEWLQTVDKLLPQIQKAKNFKGVILDVRDNPGGYLNDAVFIASEFLPVNTVVVKEEDGSGNITTMSVPQDRQGLLINYPVEVLINGGSASASEIVSGALRDDRHAKLIGEKSFGKGTVQQAIDLTDGASVHVTVAKWLTPDGTWVHMKGLQPDVKVVYNPKENTDPTKFDNQLQTAIGTLVQ